MTTTAAALAVAAWASLFEPIAAGYGIDPRIVATVIWVESRGQADVVSECGAVGLMGVMPGMESIADLLDPETNIVCGIHRLMAAIRAGGSVRRGIIAYHVGIEGARRLGWECSLDGQHYLTMFRQGWAELFGAGIPLPWAAPAREPEE